MVAYAVGFTDGSPMHHEAVLRRTSIVPRVNYMVSSKISQPSRNKEGLNLYGDPISETAARRTRRLRSRHRCDKTSPSPSSTSKPTPTPSPITHDAPPSQAPTAYPTRSPVVHTCSNGTPGIESNGACCPIKCGQCGGPGCSTLAAEFMLGASDCCQNTILENGIPCGEAPCSLIAIVAPTPAPVPPTPIAASSSSCDGENPCQNGGSCSTDPAGGYFCSCAEGFAGMICQINTDGLPPWYIELDFEGEDFTDDLKAIFQRSAARWERIILYTPGGGAPSTPAGRLLISVTIVAKDGKGGVLGSAGPTGTWWEYPSISYSGIM
ncbi:unnamed protein product, partial [Ectocarpus sp. 12 AP-2014]